MATQDSEQAPAVFGQTADRLEAVAAAVRDYLDAVSCRVHIHGGGH